MSTGAGNTYAISIEGFRAKPVNIPLIGGVGSGSVSGSSSSSLMSASEATTTATAYSPTNELGLLLGDDSRIEIEPGMTLQIVEQPSSKIALIKIKDFHSSYSASPAAGKQSANGGLANGHIAEQRIFQCQASHLQRVPSDVWPYVIAILDPQERCEFAKRPKLFDAVKQLQKDTIVDVNWVTKSRQITYTGIIRFIGQVPEIGPGYYFGVELLNLDNGESPQKDDIAFVSNYMKCEPRLALIVAANWIKFPGQEVSGGGGGGKQHHTRKLLDSLVCGARDLNNRLTRRTGSKQASDDSKSSGRGSSGGKSFNGDGFPPYARSYTPDLTSGGGGGGGAALSNRKSTDIDALHDSFHCLQMDPAEARAMHQHKKIAASISSPNLSKQDSSSSTGSSGRYGNTHPMDAYGHEYHRFVEHGHAHGQQQQQHHHHHALLDEGCRSSGRSSQNSSNNSTLKYSKARSGKAAAAAAAGASGGHHWPTGSNSSVSSGGGAGGYHSSASKQHQQQASTFLSLSDRDVVVIDSTEIDEATKSASDVIVVDPPPTLSPTDTREVELIDLLSSSNWPAEAGEVAAILNSADKKTQTPSHAVHGNGGLGAGYNTAGSSTSSNSTANSSCHSYHSHNGTASGGIGGRYERNKSLNPLAHFGGNSKAPAGEGASTGAGPTRKARTAAVEAKPTTVDVSTMTKTSAGEVSAFALPNGGSSRDNGSDNTMPAVVGGLLLPRISPSESSSQEPAIGGPVATIPSLKELPHDPTLGVGSVVEVSLDAPGDAASTRKVEPLCYGVIRWIGQLPTAGASTGNGLLMVGVELEDELIDPTLKVSNGCYNGVRLFKCPANRAIFVHASQCSQDRRFSDVPPMSPCPSRATQASSNGGGTSSKTDTTMFGKVDCPVVEDNVPPLKILKLEELEAICGKYKGIQGHHNSCYLDATLFAMFTFTSVFDSLLFRPKEPEDNPQYEEVQRVLLKEIVNPLRKNHYVRADRVLKLRKLLDCLSSVTGLMSEEKDPEEFLNSLLAQILRADPFLKLSSGLDTFYYQLFVEKDERLKLPSVQQLFEQSFLASNIKLKEVPSCLIIQMPRFGKNFKMYPRILPSQVLDVTDIIEDSPRQCNVCGNLAEYECRECYGKLQSEGLDCTATCTKCIDTVHQHSKRQNHKPMQLKVPQDYILMAPHCNVPRLYMELFAVVCIETSHYVAFVKAASGQDAPWCFFDSMADRNGEQNGYNIPEMVPVPDLPRWLTEEGANALHEEAVNDKMLPEHAKRLLCDAYMCMYQSTDVMMYR